MMVVPIIFGVWLGGIIDNKLGTGALFLILFIILGVGAA
ncbi:MAG TPA: F0F1 ATP synthase subunit, partial [Epulopiscium sp.]|nr:F0F1 ATP synthase subunit [Candidatus Epulonipiscium sp.]